MLLYGLMTISDNNNQHMSENISELIHSIPEKSSANLMFYHNTDLWITSSFSRWPLYLTMKYYQDDQKIIVSTEKMSKLGENWHDIHNGESFLIRENSFEKYEI